MKLRIVKTTLGVSYLLLSACGEAPSRESAGTHSAQEYDADTVDGLMADCLRDSSVTACLCLVEAYRVQLPGRELIDDPGKRQAVRAQVAAQCGLASQSSANPNERPSGAAAALQRSSGTDTAKNPVLKSLQPSSPEVCLQDKLTSVDKDGTAPIPIEAFERFQRECGL